MSPSSLVAITVMIALFLSWALFAEESPAYYADRMEQELNNVEVRIRDVELFAEHDRGGIQYVIRAERDVELCRTVLHSYRKGYADRKHVEQLFRQLHRDMAEFPPVE